MQPITLLTHVAVVFLVARVASGAQRDTCNPLQVDGDANRVVCVCNEESCPELEFVWPSSQSDALVVTSSKSGKRFEVQNLDKIQLDRHSQLGIDPTDNINVNLTNERQVVQGWGGAFTDASGININSLPTELADKLLGSYFGPYGLQYNFGRVPIGGTDFSTRGYTYNDVSGDDLQLKRWRLAPEDKKLKIPTIKKAIQWAYEAGQELKLFASPWSAPAWMKDNKNLVKGRLIDDDKIYASYAEYLMKFYDAYEARNISFWGATVQNEPVLAQNPTYRWNSMIFESKHISKFVSQYLGPALEARGKTRENFNLMIGDDSLGLVNKHVSPVMRRPEVAKYISGLAFHWYLSRELGEDLLLELVKELGDKINFVMMTEACEGYRLTDTVKVALGDWSRAESYANDIIEDFKRLTGAWIDWNLALDPQGGPNWARNFVDCPIIVDAKRGAFYKQPMYYALGHFSRFFRPGSVVVETAIKTNILDPDAVTAIAARNNQSGHVVMTILNKSDANRVVKINGLAHTEDGILLAVNQHSIVSVIIKT